MRTILFLYGMLVSVGAVAQNISGMVVDDHDDPLMGANVIWLSGEHGSTTDEDGTFSILRSDNTDKLIVSFVGYMSDTLTISDSEVYIRLLPEMMEEVVVKARKAGIGISNIATSKVEAIDKVELTKSACCDLAGCFNTQASVQVHTSNVLTNSKELKILGLSGVYNQLLVDGFPMLQGLNYTYGISNIPGTLVQNIFISKGANSILQGSDGPSGQINVLLADGDADRLLANAYMNSFGEKQFNLGHSFSTGDWRSHVALHTVQPAGEFDQDDDTFLDLPKLRRYELYNKWSYGNQSDWGWSSDIAYRLIDESRNGGQTSDSDLDYRQTVDMNLYELWSKTVFKFSDEHKYSLFASAQYHDQESVFGPLGYDADQLNAWAKLEYQYSYSETSNLKAGVNYQVLDLSESFTGSDKFDISTLDSDESISRLYTEHTLGAMDGRLTWMLGLSADYHDSYGWQYVPRTLIRYDLNDRLVVRANAGRSWRTAKIFSENINLLASAREIVFADDLGQDNPLPIEQAWNYGINAVKKWSTDNANGYISVDFYRTEFDQQLFVDYDAEATAAYIRQFGGESVNNGFQTDLVFNFWEALDLRLGYVYVDAYRIVDDEKLVVPFNSKHRVLYGMGYKPLDRPYGFDLNVHWYGERLMPINDGVPNEYIQDAVSDPYAVLNFQFSFNHGRFEWYTGCENIFDYRQEQGIRAWQDPTSDYFDTATVWGPLRGREFYLGVRYRILKDN